MMDRETAERMMKEDLQRARDSITGFTLALTSGKPSELSAAIAAIEETLTWRKAFVAAAKVERVAKSARSKMLNLWVDNGMYIREEVGDDRVLVRALRNILPPYRGGAVTVYRGDSMLNRRRRTYGLSWSANREIAESFATGYWRMFEGGSVLLSTEAPAEAIICSPHALGHVYDEGEYLVDRSKLGAVKLIRRYSQLDPDAFHAMTRAKSDPGWLVSAQPAECHVYMSAPSAGGESSAALAGSFTLVLYRALTLVGSISPTCAISRR